MKSKDRGTILGYTYVFEKGVAAGMVYKVFKKVFRQIEKFRCRLVINQYCTEEKCVWGGVFSI